MAVDHDARYMEFVALWCVPGSVSWKMLRSATAAIQSQRWHIAAV
jgi:hypothetical protein